MSTAPSTQRSHRAGSHRKLWGITILVLIAVPIFYTIVFTIYWPFKKQALIDILQERSRRSVTIDRFRVTYFPPGSVAEGITFWRYKHKNEPPLITIQKLSNAVTYPTLLTFQHRLDVVRVVGLHLIVPAHEPAGEPSPIMLLTASTSKSSLPIEHFYGSNLVLDFYRGSNPKPLRVTFGEVTAQHVSTKTAIAYTAQFSNSEIPGRIQTQGSLGPWNGKETAVPVHGQFTFDGGDLSPIHAISGTLFSKGTFNGQLGNISIKGDAHVRNFVVNGSSHSSDVAANYALTVNAVNGDIGLKEITAAFDRSKVEFTGSISTSRPQNGELASIDLSSQQARIEDLLDLFISAKQPPMTGDVSFSGHFGLPPGFQSFIQEMVLTGTFGITQGKFADSSTQARLTKLSETSIPGKREHLQEDPNTVLSDLAGRVDVTAGLAHLLQVEFRVPGAKAQVTGTYSLLTYQTKLSGTLLTTGNVSDTETGIKSLFLKVLTPFFRRHKKAKIIAFKITGPFGHTNVSLDVDRKPE